jgi:hypothetical protein
MTQSNSPAWSCMPQRPICEAEPAYVCTAGRGSSPTHALLLIHASDLHACHACATHTGRACAFVARWSLLLSTAATAGLMQPHIAKHPKRCSTCRAAPDAAALQPLSCRVRDISHTLTQASAPAMCTGGACASVACRISSSTAASSRRRAASRAAKPSRDARSSAALATGTGGGAGACDAAGGPLTAPRPALGS